MADDDEHMLRVEHLRNVALETEREADRRFCRPQLPEAEEIPAARRRFARYRQRRS